MASIVSKLVCIAGLLNKHGLDVQFSVQLFCENKDALKITTNPVYDERTKHVETGCHFIREKIHDVLVETRYVEKKSRQHAS